MAGGRREARACLCFCGAPSENVCLRRFTRKCMFAALQDEMSVCGASRENVCLRRFKRKCMFAALHEKMYVCSASSAAREGPRDANVRQRPGPLRSRRASSARRASFSASKTRESSKGGSILSSRAQANRIRVRSVGGSPPASPPRRLRTPRGGAPWREGEGIDPPVCCRASEDDGGLHGTGAGSEPGGRSAPPPAARRLAMDAAGLRLIRDPRPCPTRAAQPEQRCRGNGWREIKGLQHMGLERDAVGKGYIVECRNNKPVDHFLGNR